MPSRSQTAPTHTNGFLNGRWWKDAPEAIKIGFVIGYADCGAAGDNDDDRFKVPPAYGEIRESIDDFYHEAANSAVMIHDAWKIIVIKFNGKSGAEIERQTELARQAASADR